MKGMPLLGLNGKQKLKYKVLLNFNDFENVMGNRAFAPQEQMFYFSQCFQMSATIDAQ